MSDPSSTGGIPLSLADLRAFDPRARECPSESDFCCPICGRDKPVDRDHRSLGANLMTGLWKCHRCHNKGLLSEFMDERPPASARSRTGRRAGSPQKPLALPPSTHLDREPAGILPVPIGDRFPTLAGSPAAEYLIGRGLTLALCQEAGVRFAPDWHGGPAAVFPITDAHGREVAAHGRYPSAGPGGRKFHTEGPKSGGVFITPGAWGADEITITEAPIDALSLHLLGYPAIALVGASGPAWLPFFVAAMRKRVNLGFDADEPDARGIRAGDQAAEELALKLRYYDCRSVRLRPGRGKDWNDQLLALAKCRRLLERLDRQTEFLRKGRVHQTLTRAELLERAGETFEELTAACVAADGPDALGYDDSPLDPFAEDCLLIWREALSHL